MDANRRLLASLFLDRLLALHPRSVLDVGCGAGLLLDHCRASGVRAVGVEPQLEPLRESSAPRVQADATALPFDNASFDWVTMRHVPHHLEHPRAAFAEAWRVARTGLLVAEPWYDATVPSQNMALTADRWLKRQDRRRGMYHADILSAADLRALLPEEDAQCDVETHLALEQQDAGKLEALARESLGGATPTAEDAEELEGLLACARDGGLTLNGTLILRALKRGGGGSGTTRLA